MAGTDKPHFRALSEDEFNRLTPEQKLAYLSAAFRAAVGSSEPTLNRRTLRATPTAQESPKPKPEKNR